MTFSSIFNDLIVLFSFLLAGFVIREFIKPLQHYYIPASIIGGLLALILGPQVLGLIEIPESFSSMAGVMITLVLTCSVIGVDMDKSKASTYVTHLCIMVSVYGMQFAGFDNYVTRQLCYGNGGRDNGALKHVLRTGDDLDRPGADIHLADLQVVAVFVRGDLCNPTHHHVFNIVSEDLVALHLGAGVGHPIAVILYADVMDIHVIGQPVF